MVYTVMTTNEFATLHGIDYAIAAGTLKFLVAKGVVEEGGTRPSATGKGKPSTLYSVPEGPTSLELVVKKAA